MHEIETILDLVDHLSVSSEDRKKENPVHLYNVSFMTRPRELVNNILL